MEHIGTEMVTHTNVQMGISVNQLFMSVLLSNIMCIQELLLDA